jgi:hypothetical protein
MPKPYEKSIGGIIQALEDLIAATVGGGGSGVTTWGSITGTLSSQTDLNTALTGKQPSSAELSGLASLVANGLVERTGAGTYSSNTITSFIKTLLDDVDAPTARTTLGVVIGTNVQAFSSELSGLSSLAANGLVERNGIGSYVTTPVTSFIKTLLDDVDAPTARTTLGVVIGTNVQAFSARLGEIDSNFAGASAGNLIRKNAAGTALEYAQRSDHYILIQDQKTAGTDGGTFTSGADQTRDLNTKVVDTGSLASVASNQITLAAGTYRFKISAPGCAVDRHQAILYNVTDSSEVAVGVSECAASGSFVCNRSFIQGRMTIASSKVFEVRHRCQTTAVTYGLGVASNFGRAEIYTVAEFWVE